MYKISNNKRKYSPTPIVQVITDENGKETEEVVLISTLKKKEGDALSEKVVHRLNHNEYHINDILKDINV